MLVVVSKVHENLFAGEAVSLTVPTVDGEVTVLPHHEPFVSTLKEGTITVRTTDDSHTFFATSGVLEISNDQVTVLL